MELGIADHIWLAKRAAIAQTVDELGDNFKPAMRAGWMAQGISRWIGFHGEWLWARYHWFLIDI